MMQKIIILKVETELEDSEVAYHFMNSNIEIRGQSGLIVGDCQVVDQMVISK